MKTFFPFFMAVLMSLQAGASPAFAARPGSTALNFLKIEAGARAAGAGGAFTAVADDASAVYWNPAGLAQLRHRQLSVMHLSWFEGVNYQFASYVHPLRKAGTLGAAVYHLSTDDIPSYDNYGALLDTKVRASDLAVALSWGGRFAAAELGVTAKFAQENLAGASAGAVAADIGLLYRLRTGGSLPRWLGRETRLGFAARNIGSAVTFAKEAFPLPAVYRFGVAQDLFSDTLTLSCDVSFPSDSDYAVNAGLDYRITGHLAVRAGYRLGMNAPEFDVQSGPSAGIGFGNEYISVDYAFVPYSVLGTTHRLGISCRFGSAWIEDLVEAKLRNYLSMGRKHFQAKDYLGAYAAFKNVLLIDPTNVSAKEHLGEIQSKIDAIKADRYLKLAEIYLRDNKLPEAKELLDNVLALFPGHPGAMEHAGRIEAALKGQKTARADSMFNQALEFYRQKQYADAVSLWEKVLLVDPGHAQAQEHIARAKGEIAAIAEKSRKEERERVRRKADDLVSRGAKLLRERRWEKARQLFDEALLLDPGHTGAERSLSETNGRFADECHQKALKHYADGNRGEAIRLWEQAARLAPENKDIAARLAQAQNEYREANRAKAEEYNRQGLKEYDLGNLKSAVELWEKASALDPGNAKVRNSLGRAKEELLRLSR